ncbi:hypothetical protein [Streptomyces sp. I6]|uniref:hypothetical protein n=1 Tax=Streptomyces sp. I6 TaxID=2483113 RepID=UPI000F44AC5C|nr:hypothetical protein [Streptomyces sp. I6]RNL73268.1 hypothetical protein EBF04_24595 [Streptomyces sp. I6]
MAAVGAVYGLAPMPREPGDVIRGGDDTDRADRPERPGARPNTWRSSIAGPGGLGMPPGPVQAVS